MITNFYIFYQFLIRDTYVHIRHHWNTILLNHVIIYPMLYSISFAYILTNAYFGADHVSTGTMLFAGNIIIPMIVSAYKITFDLFFDMQNNRFVDYQIILLNPKLLILERIFFAWLFTFCTSLPFYPIAKLLIGSNLDFSNTNWIQVILMLALGSLFCVSYHQLVSCMITRRDQIGILWSRVNDIFISFGGFWFPLAVMYVYWPAFGTLMYLNPMIYVTEGLRSAILGGNEFLSVYICAPILFSMSMICIVFTCSFFKKRMDHI